MSDDKNDLTVWRTDQNNQWGLYKNTDYQLPLVKDEDATDKNEKPKIKAQSDTPFYFSKLKQEIKGTMICTPKGYGIIQSIDPAKNVMSVKVQGTIYDFDRNEISNEIPLKMIYLKNSVKIEETIYLSAASTINELFEKMESSLEASGNVLDIKLFYQGKELEKSDDTIEKLRIAPLSKFLATYVPGKPMCVNRFTSAHSGWCVGGNGVDGITFQASKNIRVIGFGVYPGTSQEVLAGSGKLYQGESTKGTMVSSVELEMLKSKDASDNEPQRVLFDKPYLLKAGESCSVTLTFPNSGNSYYGSGGQLKVDGEGDVQFTFKNCDGSYNGTGTGSGQIPTIYYYV